MKQTSRISRSRSVQGSRPRTRSSPWWGMRPRIALSAVDLPAPLGPMSPRMRPSSTRRLTPSSAMVVPKALRRPRASMHAMASALLLVGRATFQQFFRFQAEPLDGCVDPGPLFGKKFVAFALQQQVVRARFDEHAETSLRLDQLLFVQLLVALHNRDRIDPILGGDSAHGRQRVAFLEHALENQRDDTVPKLSVNWLTVVPFAFHPCA